MSYLLTQKDIDRFWTYVNKVDESLCWEWRGGRSDGRNPAFWLNGHTVQARRIIFQLTYGQINDVQIVVSNCPKNDCMNPRHMVGGSNQDRVAQAQRMGKLAKDERHGSKTKPERVARGDRNGRKTKPYGLDCHPSHLHPEIVRGERNPHNVYPESLIRYIRRLWRQGYTQVAISELVGIRQSYISAIVNRKVWQYNGEP